ncbi:hypothetical protein DFQ13_101562 [Actinokineospora spheciospongiae]|nr:hypothetical protein DFQ13_101562 [Actinokineospora spheciospongiae]
MEEDWWAHLARTMPARALSWTHPYELDRVAAAIAPTCSGIAQRARFPAISATVYSSAAL